MLAKVPRIITSGAVGIEVDGLHPLFHQILGGGTGFGNIAGRGDVIGGHRISEHRQRTRALDVGDRGRRHGDAIEVGRILHIGGFSVPGINLARRSFDGTPVRIAQEHVGVALLEHRRIHGGRHRGRHVRGARPDILEIDRLAVAADAQGFSGDIDV
jgi:hypothetical protein